MGYGRYRSVLSRAAMLEMMQLPEYQEISVREAGLAGQLNIETCNAIIF